MTHDSRPTTVAARADVFGHEPTAVELSVIPRTSGWRVSRAAPFLLGGAVLAPVVAIVPPHAPWAVGAMAGGLVLGLRKWHEHATLVGVEGACPRCGAALVLHGHPPLKSPHALACDGCGSPVRLRPDEPGADASAPGADA